MQVHATSNEAKLSDILAFDPDELAERMLEPTTMRAIYEDTESLINRNRSPQGLYALIGDVTDTMEGLWRDLAPDTEPYACRKGCSWCCHQSVMVTAPEVLLAAKFLRDNLSPAEVAKLRDRIAERAQAAEGLTNDERMDRRMACSFLMDDICTIYPVRPLQCRGGYSEDEGYCVDLLTDRDATQTAVADGSRDGKYLLLPKMLYDSAQIGMAGALQNDGLNTDPLELTAAMAIALDDPNVTEKWLGGWPVFADARLHRQASETVDKFATRRSADG